MVFERSDIRKMLEAGTVAARLAGQRAVEELKYIKTTVKNGNELVTQADTICQKIAIDRIKEAYPDHGFIAEEGRDGKPLKQPPRTAEAVWWVIDPIDGTNNYAHGMLNFAVSVSAMHKGEPIVGVIFEPATDSMFTAAVDTDAQLNASRISAGDEDISEYSSVGIDSHYSGKMAGPINTIMTHTRFRNYGATAMHLAYVAKGSIIGAIGSMSKLWDIAAGTRLIENAGGIITDLNGNKIFPVDLDSYDGQPYPFIAANKKTHPKLLEIFKS